jgi:hypothetical protein
MNSLNWPDMAHNFDYYKPTIRPLANAFPRGLFQEAAPHNLAIPPGIPMSQYIGYQTKSRVSRPGDAVSGLVITPRNVEKVEKALKKTKKHHADFYTDFNMHSKEHAEAWLKNAKKTLSTRSTRPTRSTRNGMGGGRKTRNARKKTRKTRKTRKTMKTRK